jgi:flagellar protein FliJ
MTRSKRLQPVHRIAKNNEQLAGRRAAESSRALAVQETRLQELCAYREHYARQLETAGRLDAFRMHDYRAFLTRLNDAIRQQELLLEKLRARHRQTEDDWLATRTHSQAVDKLLERFRASEHLQEDRGEQRATDECAGRARETPEKS